MFSALFRPKRRPSAAPPGAVVFAIGDVHGRNDLLVPLLAAISQDEGGGARRIVVGLGDYIDRGPWSRAVIDQLIDLQRSNSAETHFLRGNHEQALLDFLDDPAQGPKWCEYGGRECLLSYDVRPPTGLDEADWLAARAAFAAALPTSHLTFLRALKPSLTLGDYFFTHAGARPGVALEDQTAQDLQWIREPFLSDRKPFDKVVVHGHSVNTEVHVDDRRIGIDTGAYATGLLTAVRLQGWDQNLIQTQRGKDGVVRCVRLAD